MGHPQAELEAATRLLWLEFPTGGGVLSTPSPQVSLAKKSTIFLPTAIYLLVDKSPGQ